MDGQGLALEKGWPATTVADIATRAGIGKGAVYLEFADKPAILDAVLRRSMRGLTADAHRRALDHPGLLDLPTVYRLAIEALLADPLMRTFHLGDQTVPAREFFAEVLSESATPATSHPTEQNHK